MLSQPDIAPVLALPHAPPGRPPRGGLSRQDGRKESLNQRMRVLLVEDDPDHAELIRRGFQKQALNTDLLVVPDGQEALDFLFGQGQYADAPPTPPNLILLDLKLPKVSGLEVLKIVKQSDGLCHIPVVILTTSDDRQDITQAYEYHANSFLVKPSDSEEFNQLLEALRLYWLDHNYTI